MGLKVLGVSGSLREKSSGLRALGQVLEAARQFGAEVRLLDLRQAKLPMYDPDAPAEEQVAGVLAEVRWAEAFVLSSPDYHGGMSGAMKNFLDYHWSQYAGKLFAFLCASHEKGQTAMEQMRTAVRQCYGWSLPYGIWVNSREDLDSDGRFVPGTELPARLRMMARDLVVYGRLLRGQFLEDVAKKAPETFASRYG